MINREHAEGDIDSKRLEEGGEVLLDFNKLSSVAGTGQAVLPVVVQDARSGEVLILAYANEQALRYTLENGIAAFWSTSRNTLWVKGKTSGDTLKIVDIRVNCEQNSLLYRVRLEGKGSCHTKNKAGDTRLGCYYRVLREDRLESLDP